MRWQWCSSRPSAIIQCCGSSNPKTAYKGGMSGEQKINLIRRGRADPLTFEFKGDKRHEIKRRFHHKAGTVPATNYDSTIATVICTCLGVCYIHWPKQRQQWIFRFTNRGAQRKRVVCRMCWGSSFIILMHVDFPVSQFIVSDRTLQIR